MQYFTAFDDRQTSVEEIPTKSYTFCSRLCTHHSKIVLHREAVLPYQLV